MTPAIAQADPGRSYRAHAAEIDEAIARVLRRGRFILDEEVELFERELAAWVGTRFAVAVGSGTDAIAIALRATGIGAGDEVVTVSHTAVATVAAIEMAGAEPVLVDVDPSTMTIDPTRFMSVRTSVGFHVVRSKCSRPGLALVATVGHGPPGAPRRGALHQLK